MTALFLRAPAKLNLVLRIVGRRADGYHLLETLFHAIDLADDLWLEPMAGDGTRLTLGADDAALQAPAGGDNLVVRALAAFRARTGLHAGCRVHLHKRIPMGGGLGGGSSDAAAALRLVNAAFGAPLDAAALHDLARPLGADVPFFLRGGSQWGRGVGDELAPATVPARHFLLLLPPFGCATAAVYRNYAAHWNSGPPQASIRPAEDHRPRDSDVMVAFANDLEPAAERVAPALAVLRSQVAASGFRDVRMTGSGSTLFLAFADGDGCADAQRRLQPLASQGVRLLTARSAGPASPPVPAAWSPGVGAPEPWPGVP